MKTLKFNLLFCALAALCVMSSCSKDEDAAQKQDYSCYLKMETFVTDTALADDEVYQETLQAEATLIEKALWSAFSPDSLGNFTFQATDTTALKADVSARSQTALAGIGDTWKGYHQIWVCHSLNEKQSTTLYKCELGKAGGQNGNSFYNISRSDKHYFTELGISQKGSVSNASLAQHIVKKRYSYLSTSTKAGETLYRITYNLNYGNSGKPVYLCAWCHSDQSPVTDVICLFTESHKFSDYTLQYNGRTYQMCTSIAGANLDCNYGAGGPYLYLMYTRDYFDGYGLCNMQMEWGSDQFTYRNEDDSSSWTRTVSGVGEDGQLIGSICDMNHGTGGTPVALHMKYSKIE